MKLDPCIGLLFNGQCEEALHFYERCMEAKIEFMMRWGESPMALCVRRPGATTSEDAVRDWANGQLGKTQRLAAVEFRDSLPRSTIGKIMKRELREPYWAGRTAKI